MWISCKVIGKTVPINATSVHRCTYVGTEKKQPSGERGTSIGSFSLTLTTHISVSNIQSCVRPRTMFANCACRFSNKLLPPCESYMWHGVLHCAIQWTRKDVHLWLLQWHTHKPQSRGMPGLPHNRGKLPFFFPLEQTMKRDHSHAQLAAFCDLPNYRSFLNLALSAAVHANIDSEQLAYSSYTTSRDLCSRLLDFCEVSFMPW